MKRYDLRQYKDDFLNRMGEIINDRLKDGEVGIFLFEIGDSNIVLKTNEFIRSLGFNLLNSVRFNEVDWVVVVKKEIIQV